MKPVTTSQNMAEAKHAHTKTKSGSDAYHSVTPHVKKKSTIGVSSNATICDGKHERQNPNVDKNKTVENLKDRYLESERALEEYRREITTAMGCVIRMIDTKSREATETKEAQDAIYA